MKLLVINAVGMRPKDLRDAPFMRSLAEEGWHAPLDTVFPAVTCTVQASWLTGTLPSEHGIVGNGWYFRELAQVWLWRQANALIQGEQFTTLLADAGVDCAKMFWWFNMYSSCRYSVTPRPEYHANGLKRPGLYSHPAELQEDLQKELGAFPLFNFWGPAADLRSTRWIVDSSIAMIQRHDPPVMLSYLPHLDYDHQRFGPDHAKSREGVAALDGEVERLVNAARAAGAEVMILSEYGIEEAQTPVFINRVLREQGYLAVQETSHGQLLDAGASRAFAVVDHQAAHVYVRDAVDRAAVEKLLKGLPGVAEVWQEQEKEAHGIAHERSGELVCVADEGCWFAYHYWLDEQQRPDFANTVDIHRKPGYDPTELFLDPQLRFPKVRIIKNLAKKLLGFRYLMDVIGTDPSLVRGSHGRIYKEPERGAIFICTQKQHHAERVSALEIKQRVLQLAGC